MANTRSGSVTAKKGMCNSLWHLLSLWEEKAWSRWPGLKGQRQQCQPGAWHLWLWETNPLRTPGHKQMDASNQVVLPAPPSLNKFLSAKPIREITKQIRSNASAHCRSSQMQKVFQTGWKSRRHAASLVTGPRWTLSNLSRPLEHILLTTPMKSATLHTNLQPSCCT